MYAAFAGHSTRLWKRSRHPLKQLTWLDSGAPRFGKSKRRYHFNNSLSEASLICARPEAKIYYPKVLRQITFGWSWHQFHPNRALETQRWIHTPLPRKQGGFWSTLDREQRPGNGIQVALFHTQRPVTSKGKQARVRSNRREETPQKRKMDAFVRWQCRDVDCYEKGIPGAKSACPKCGKSRRTSKDKSPRQPKRDRTDESKPSDLPEPKSHTPKMARLTLSAGTLSASPSVEGRPYTSKYKSAVLPSPWQSAHRGSVIFRRFNGESKTSAAKYGKRRIAAFDFDGCLCGLSFNRADDNRRIHERVLFPSVKPILTKLAESGYQVVIFSNEYLGRLKNPTPIQNAVNRKTKRIDEFLEYVGVPIDVYLATEKDQFRKPSTRDREKEGRHAGGPGMWKFMQVDPFEQTENLDTVKLDMEQSFFVGDAAGRTNDVGDGDKNFALEVGVKFYTPEQFFLVNGVGAQITDACKPTLQESEELNSEPILASLKQVVTANANVQENRDGNALKLLLIMVGLPGSGKSTVASALAASLGSKNCVRFSQDALKTSKKVQAAVEEALRNTSQTLVIVDRTNISLEQRRQWINLAKKYDATAAIFYIEMHATECVARCEVRSDHEGVGFPTERHAIQRVVGKFRGDLAVPTGDEGAAYVKQVSGHLPREALLAELAKFSLGCLTQGHGNEAKPTTSLPTTLAFSSLSTNDFGFDPAKAAEVFVRVSTRWLSQHKVPGVELRMVEPPGSKVLQFLRDTTPLKRRIELTDALSVCEGSLTDAAARGAFMLAVGCSDHVLARPSESKANLDVHKLLRADGDMALDKLLKRQFGVIEALPVATVYPLRIPKVHPCRETCPNLEYVLFVKGPNMNPSRPNCLLNDYAKGQEDLERCYLAVFDALRSCVTDNKQLSTKREMQGQTASVSASASGSAAAAAPSPLIKSKNHFTNALHPYCSDPVPEHLQDKVVSSTENWRTIYDAYPKAQVHLLVLCLEPSGLADIDNISQLKPEHLSSLKELRTFIVDTLCPKYVDVDFRAGFHAIPSLRRLHLHFISQDLTSDKLKNRKHWISFTHEDYFIDLKKAISWLEAGDVARLEQAPSIAANIKDGLRCHRCGQEQKNMPKLKAHIAQCTAALRTSGP